MPGRQKGGESTALGWLDLFAKDSQRGTPKASEHIGVAPLSLAGGPAWAQFTAHKCAHALQSLERMTERVYSDQVALAWFGGEKRPVGRSVASHQLDQRVGYVIQECLWQATRRHDPQRVAPQPGLLGGHVALLPADPQMN